MFLHRVDDEIALELINGEHAETLFGLLDGCREYLAEWLAFAAVTVAVEQTEGFCEDAMKRRADGTALRCAILYRGEICGTIGFESIDRMNDVAELGYWVAESMQGRGIVTRAVRGMLQIGFDELRLHRVLIRVAEGNRRSWAIPERLGFVLEGTSRQAIRVAETRHDVREYAMLAPDWAR